MINRIIIFITLILFTCSSSLFAFDTGNKLKYFNAGYGRSSDLSSSHVDWNPSMLYNATWMHATFNNMWTGTMGFNYEYFILNFLTVGGAINVEYTHYNVKIPHYDMFSGGTAYRDDNFNIISLTTPIGLRFYINNILIGGGVYYSLNTVKFMNLDLENMKANNSYGLYADIGLYTDTVYNYHHYMIFVRYRHGLNTAVSQDGYDFEATKLRAFTVYLASGSSY